MNYRSKLLLPLIAAFLFLQPSAFAHRRDSDRDSDIARAAYEAGYRDGYNRGYSDHGRRVIFDYRCSDYGRADRGYRHELGERARYQAAYRLAFRAGYGDGYRVRPRARVVISVIFAPGREDDCFDDDDYCDPGPYYRHHHEHERRHHHDDDDDD